MKSEIPQLILFYLGMRLDVRVVLTLPWQYIHRSLNPTLIKDVKQ
jgi:hypothetical protein